MYSRLGRGRAEVHFNFFFNNSYNTILIMEKRKNVQFTIAPQFGLTTPSDLHGRDCTGRVIVPTSKNMNIPTKYTSFIHFAGRCTYLV